MLDFPWGQMVKMPLSALHLFDIEVMLKSFIQKPRFLSYICLSLTQKIHLFNDRVHPVVDIS